MVSHSRFLIGLPDDGDRHELKRQVLRWLTTEPKIGRSFTMYVGAPSQLQSFSVLIVDIRDGCFHLLNKRGWHHRKRGRIGYTQEQWKKQREAGLLFCEDWV